MVDGRRCRAFSGSVVSGVFVEYVDGGSLVEWVELGKLYAGGAQQALERILDVAIQVAWGLQYTHEQGLTGRRVKLDELFAPSTMRDIPLSEGQHI